eukprot:gnl/Chilomastix_cuspidata/2731.p1 GENE.gnl/Chilomastix_cuspidata/2731~~gnl/Chilomastix_cuspidata/2731.p1  ORF type:complete len:576 (+),score=217.96 gnl/Chilomastix_cuspidata/2731:832-2559(+)
MSATSQTSYQLKGDLLIALDFGTSSAISLYACWNNKDNEIFTEFENYKTKQPISTDLVVPIHGKKLVYEQGDIWDCSRELPNNNSESKYRVISCYYADIFSKRMLTENTEQLKQILVTALKLHSAAARETVPLSQTRPPYWVLLRPAGLSKDARRLLKEAAVKAFKAPAEKIRLMSRPEIAVAGHILHTHFHWRSSAEVIVGDYGGVLATSAVKVVSCTPPRVCKLGVCSRGEPGLLNVNSAVEAVLLELFPEAKGAAARDTGLHLVAQAFARDAAHALRKNVAAWSEYKRFVYTPANNDLFSTYSAECWEEIFAGLRGADARPRVICEFSGKRVSLVFKKRFIKQLFEPVFDTAVHSFLRVRRKCRVPCGVVLIGELAEFRMFVERLRAQNGDAHCIVPANPTRHAAASACRCGLVSLNLRYFRNKCIGVETVKRVTRKAFLAAPERDGIEIAATGAHYVRKMRTLYRPGTPDRGPCEPLRVRPQTSEDKEFAVTVYMWDADADPASAKFFETVKVEITEQEMEIPLREREFVLRLSFERSLSLLCTCEYNQRTIVKTLTGLLTQAYSSKNVVW